MEKYVSKMSEYLKMDEEIAYEEFNQFFVEYYGYLGEQLDDLPQEDLVKARYISSIIQSNSEARSRRKHETSKRFKRMAEKSKIWTDAISYRLGKMGLSEQQIDQAVATFAETL